MSYWKRIYKIAIILLCILAMIAIISIFLPRLNTTRELQLKNVELSEENTRIEEATRELKRKRERFLTDPKFVVRTAREQGMVKSNETVFRFTNRQNQASSGTQK